jgi:hypothetical protein
MLYYNISETKNQVFFSTKHGNQFLREVRRNKAGKTGAISYENKFLCMDSPSSHPFRL